MKSSELREKYLAFFESKGCKRWPSSSLVPDDPSLLLTSAGMVQFKPYFLQQKQLEDPYVGTATVQKCVRTTDIDIIGTTGRHLSFFEMLGNFSFGAYFKKEMCAWAYEFSTEVLGFDPDRLYYTVYLDDDETIEIWKSIGVPEDRIRRLGEKDNFWTAGPTGPCGPCSELYYDQGAEFGCGSPDCGPGCDCDRYLEYWNCVFTQFDRQEDGTLVPLPKKNIDTGMGLERTAAILQGVKSNYDADILRGLIVVGERLSGLAYTGSFDAVDGADPVLARTARDDLSLRILADHARAVTFMIADGILPANEGRGYVLRRLLRRAMRHGQLLGIEPPFLEAFVEAVIDEMGDVYPELAENRRLIERIVRNEEDRFAQTLRQGQGYLEQHLAQLPDGHLDRCGSSRRLDGAVAFELHDRFGFPIDLTVEIAAEQGVSVDREGFEAHMEQQRERARTHAKDDAWGTYLGVYSDLLNEHGATSFEGYDHHELDAQVLALIVNGEKAVEVCDGQQATVVLDRTPFYGEMGGQVGDTGTLVVLGAPGAAPEPVASVSVGVFTVEDTQVFEKSVYAHIGRVDGTLRVGDAVSARIDIVRRERIQRNHTATHLLHHALQEVLGAHVKQAGSLVSFDHLRFDFTHFEHIAPEQIVEIEQLVNTLIMEDGTVTSYEASLSEAREQGVTALFGEKYGERVRVLEAGPRSRELCGGTHVQHTAQIGFCKILGESSIGANLRRIEAVTSFDALAHVNRQEAQLHASAALLKSSPGEVPDKVAALVAKVRELEADAAASRKASAALDVQRLASAAHDVGYALVVARVDGLEAEGLRSLWDGLRTTLGASSAVVLGTLRPTGSPLVLAAATPAAVEAGFDAGAVIRHVSSCMGGSGGGKPSMAQAGGKDPAGLDGALTAARALLEAPDEPS
ncbi:MAG: alanine--tRNA ligase [Coriobacteriales bacterium]|jgi:alanyl-tRNA synthetase|nr:alanine--tRNA ligase [Coriobacteriales bacterium]